ncbi:MAG: L,D-transpeptidase [Hoeflea sp.]|jgi:lipoprotein-anchoring transpeptidase ErfK/SrfK|uniref:L,D-transpeptidase n=1 Tax=Hoeflea sp. TaxID=1940281 RepID=UPI003297DF03|tara:strand:+ start:3046 stop:3714 length:669 start_codon:yes stop_codon:yes gene_type:complete
MNRRQFIYGAASTSVLALSGCTTATKVGQPVEKLPTSQNSSNIMTMYGPMPEERFPLPAIEISKVPSKFRRRQVNFTSPYPVGTVIVDTKTYYLHLVQENGQAMRYGVGLGRQGFEWSGEGVIQWKQAWPKWTPPDEMIARQPELEKWSADNGGMPPGLSNPLGARALYIFQNGKDTLYRIHGSPEYWTIGKSVSSGCVRMINQDIVDLYGRVTSGARLIVL